MFWIEENRMFPSSTISPWSGRMRPAIQFNNVVLPLPEGPKIEDIPSGKHSEASRLKVLVFFLSVTFKKVFIWLLFSVCVLKRGVSKGSKMSELRREELVVEQNYRYQLGVR